MLLLRNWSLRKRYIQDLISIFLEILHSLWFLRNHNFYFLYYRFARFVRNIFHVLKRHFQYCELLDGTIEFHFFLFKGAKTSFLRSVQIFMSNRMIRSFGGIFLGFNMHSFENLSFFVVLVNLECSYLELQTCKIHSHFSYLFFMIWRFVWDISHF